MIMTSEWAFILDEADELSAMILSSEQAQKLRNAYNDVYSNENLYSKYKHLHE